MRVLSTTTLVARDVEKDDGTREWQVEITQIVKQPGINTANGDLGLAVDAAMTQAGVA